MSRAVTYVARCGVRGVRLLELRQMVEPGRGHLAVGELGKQMPFVPRRFFLTYGVPEGKTRGDHAHRRCQQLLICTHGTCQLWLDDGFRSQKVLLTTPTTAVFIPPMVWVSERLGSPESILLVFASRKYEPEDYIHDYDEFLMMASQLDHYAR